MTGHVSALVGQRLRAFREWRKITQLYVAENMRSAGFTWTRETVSRVESGDRVVSVDELFVLTAVLGVDRDELMPWAS